MADIDTDAVREAFPYQRVHDLCGEVDRLRAVAVAAVTYIAPPKTADGGEKYRHFTDLRAALASAGYEPGDDR